MAKRRYGVHGWTAAAAALALASAGCGASEPPQSHELGIEVVGIALMAGEDLARLDYRVVDFKAAERSLRNEIRLVPAGADARPLAVLSAGRLGPMRQRPSRGGRKQFILFTNPGRRVHKGDVVTVSIGGFLVPDVPVS